MGSARRSLISLCVLAGLALTCGTPTRTEREVVEEVKQEPVKPKITYSKETVAKPGETILLDCGVQGLDLGGVNDFQITWSKIDVDNPTNSFPLTKGEKVILFSSKYDVIHPQDSYQYSLQISDLGEKDTGMYRCIVNFGDNQKVHADVPVMIETPAYFLDDYTKTLTVTEGDAISIDCRPGGSPTPEVYWERLNQPLPYYGGRLFKANQLEIPELKRDHKGHYVCHADNGIGSPVMSEVILEVQYKPDLAVEESQIFAGPVQSVSLTCAARAHPEPDVAWYREDLIVLGSSNIRLRKEVSKADGEHDQITLTLTINEVTAEDYGKYTCRAINLVGQSESIAEVAMKSPPMIVRQSENEVIYDKEFTLARDALPTVLECEAEGQPQPEYRWTKNGEALVWQADTRLSLEPNTGNLLMVDLTPSDNGFYQCFAYNELGTAVADPIHLINSTQINFKDVKKEKYEVEAELGRPFQLTCPEVEGYPEPKLTWVRAYDNDDATTQLEFINDERVIADAMGNLWFSYVTEEDDTQKHGFRYLCLGSSSLSPTDMSIGSVVTLSVKTPEEGPANDGVEHVSVEGFVMYHSPDNQTFKAGQTNKIWCIYGGEPTPTIVWTREDGEELEDGRYEIQNNGRTLVLLETDETHAATYTCEASNGIGEQKSVSMSVDIDTPPVFEHPMSSQTVQEGMGVTFTCEVNSTDDMKYEWLFNGRPLTVSAGSRRKLDDQTLSIHKVTAADIGNYACNASDSKGYAYGQAVLNVITGDLRRDNQNTQCVDIHGITKELSELRQTVLDMNLMIQQQRQSHDKTLINLMQRISESLPESNHNVFKTPVNEKIEEEMAEVEKQ